jgi:hypothetical protein
MSMFLGYTLGVKEAFLWGWIQRWNEKTPFAPRLNLTRGRGIPLHYPHGAGSVSVSDIIGGSCIGSVCLRSLGGKYGSRIKGGGLLHYIYVGAGDW